MNDEIIEQLVSFGLSKREALIYLALLKFGTRPISYIAKQVGLNRGTAYQLLHQLLEKGLVTKSSKTKTQCFCASDPNHFKLLIENSEREILKKKERVEQIVPQLAAMMGDSGKKPKVQYHSGIDGVRTAMNDYLNATDKTLRAFVAISEIDGFVGAEFYYDNTLTRISRGYSLKVIRAFEKDSNFKGKDKHRTLYGNSEEEKREVRFLSSQHAPPMTMYMYDSKVILISSKKENYALIVESKEFCEMQKNFFEYIWKTLPENDDRIQL